MSYKGQECTQHVVSRWYTICQNLVCLCQKAKTILPVSNSWKKYNLIFGIKVKFIQHSWMYTTHCTMVIHSHSMTMWKDKNLLLNTKPCHKPYRFDLEIKGQCRISNHECTRHRAMCQILYVKAKLLVGHKEVKKPKNLTLSQRSMSNGDH